MAQIPDLSSDPTLEAMDKAMLAREAAKQEAYYSSGQAGPPRLGASAVGHECERYAWYTINRRDLKKSPDAKGLRTIEEGYRTEDLMAERLRLVPGIELWTKDENGKQFGFTLFDNRLVCKVDGVIVGLLQAPKTPHVWENKACNEKKFNELKKLKDEKGEKEALKHWDEVFFVQAQLAMGGLELYRHYLTVNTPGGRDVISCRTDFNKAIYENILTRAERILKSPSEPVRLSDRPEFYKCKWCDFHEVCHATRN